MQSINHKDSVAVYTTSLSQVVMLCFQQCCR